MHILLFLSLSISSIFPGKEKKEGLSQTESYLRVIPLEEVGKKLGIPNIERYRDLINTIIEREKKHPDHYAFYHGAKIDFLPFLILNTKLQLLPKQYKDKFVFLRPHSEFFHESISSAEFLAKFHREIHDGLNKWRTILLSTNLSFPGNLIPGESSLDFINRNITYRNPESLWGLLANDNLLVSYLKCKIRLLLSQLETNQHGILLQILIPKDIVDYCVYICLAWGGPRSYKIPNIEQGWDTTKNYYTRISPILAVLQQNPNRIKKVLPYLQARIKLDREFFSNPESGVKIYLNHMIDNEAYRAFEQEIEKIANTILLHRFCTILAITKPLPFKYIAIKDMISTAETACNNKDWRTKDNGLRHFIELVKHEEGIGPAQIIADDILIGLSEKDYEIPETAQELRKLIEEKKKRFRSKL